MTNYVGALSDYAGCAADYGNATTGGDGAPFDTATSGANGMFRVGNVIDPPTPNNTGKDNPSGAQLRIWKPRVKMSTASDGTSNTLFVGEKNVHSTQQGLGSIPAGDGPVWSGDANGYYAQRMAGPGLPPSAGTSIAFVPRPLVRFPDQYNAGNGLNGILFGGPHQNICQFVLVDGSVRVIAVNIDTVNLGYLANPADGNVITFDY